MATAVTKSYLQRKLNSHVLLSTIMEIIVVPKDGDVRRAKRVFGEYAPLGLRASFYPSFQALNDKLGADILAARQRLKPPLIG